MAEDVGRPSQLKDEQFLLKIRDLVLEGLTEEKMQQILEIPKGTWDYWKWKNYESFQDKLLTYKHERILAKAEANIEQSMSSDDEKVRVDVSKFALERLNKKVYSVRQENTGANGQPLQVVIHKEVAEAFNIHETT